MNIKTLIAVIAAIVVVGGAAYWFMQGQPHTSGAAGTQSQAQGQTLGTYEYACDNGVKFALTIAGDMSSVTLAPHGQAPFSTVTLPMVANAAYASPEGEMSLTGAGEQVTIGLGAQTMVCAPVPAGPDAAPFNWGDGEGTQ